MDIVATFQELRGEGMEERVAGGTFGQASLSHLTGNRFLKERDCFVRRRRPPQADSR